MKLSLAAIFGAKLAWRSLAEKMRKLGRKSNLVWVEKIGEISPFVCHFGRKQKHDFLPLSAHKSVNSSKYSRFPPSLYIKNGCFGKLRGHIHTKKKKRVQ